MSKETSKIQYEILRQLSVMEAADRVFEEGLIASADVIHH